MLAKLFIWLGKLSTAVKVLGGLIGFAITIYGLKVGYDKIIINKHDTEIQLQETEQRRNEEFKELQTSFKNFNSVVLDSISTLSKIVRGTNVKVESLTSSSRKLKFYMENKAATKEDLRDIYRIWDDNEKKNDGNNLFPTVLN